MLLYLCTYVFLMLLSFSSLYVSFSIAEVCCRRRYGYCSLVVQSGKIPGTSGKFVNFCKSGKTWESPGFFFTIFIKAHITNLYSLVDKIYSCIYVFCISIDLFNKLWKLISLMLRTVFSELQHEQICSLRMQ